MIQRLYEKTFFIVFYFLSCLCNHFLLLSIPIVFLHVEIFDMYLTTHPFPHPTSKNEKDLLNEILFKNFKHSPHVLFPLILLFHFLPNHQIFSLLYPCIFKIIHLIIIFLILIIDSNKFYALLITNF